jgi:hypothetical protein
MVYIKKHYFKYRGAEMPQIATYIRETMNSYASDCFYGPNFAKFVRR